jgi:hypothetical protein
MNNVETMAIEVLAPDVREIWTFDCVAYTIHADGRLEVHLPDGTPRYFEGHEWMDVRYPA